MRFFVATLALAAIASAQNSTMTATSTSTALTPEQSCLTACAATDICCQAACVKVPCPSELQANATTACAAQCVQGNGSQAETDAYARCQQQCISQNFMTNSAMATATGTGASGSATFGASATGASASGSASRTASGSASSASSTGNAAPETRSFIAGAGLFGLIIAGLAL